jgi:hypothetical protein
MQPHGLELGGIRELKKFAREGPRFGRYGGIDNAELWKKCEAATHDGGKSNIVDMNMFVGSGRKLKRESNIIRARRVALFG